MPRTLILISELAEDRTFASEVAAAAGIAIEKFASARQGLEVVAKDPTDMPAIIFADVTTIRQYLQLETAIQDTVGLLSEKINSNYIHFITSESLDKAPHLTQSSLFGHFILRNFGDSVEAGRHYGRVVKATLGDRAFGLKRLFKTGAKIQEVKLATSSQKHNAVEAIKNYLVTAKFQTRMATVIANAVDELLMNAIFDAPVDSLGVQLHANLPRTTALKLEGRNAVEMHVGYDSYYVAITAVDLYGSLDKNKLLACVQKNFLDEEYKVKKGEGGAGIGLSAVFRSGASFLFVTEAHAKTEVTVLFKRTDSFREFKDQFRFLSSQFYF